MLLVYDAAEVRKIVTSARWVTDRLNLVEAVTSPRGLLVSFKVTNDNDDSRLCVVVVVVVVKVAHNLLISFQQ